jgi:hypothetical protein
MLSSAFRAFHHEALFGPLREAAKAVAQDFLVEGMKCHFTRWADNFYGEGTQIADEQRAVAFAKETQADIDALRRQATLQRLYADVDIPA